MQAPVITAKQAANPVLAAATLPEEHRATQGRQRVITVAHPVWRLECGGLERQLLQTIRGLPSGRFRHVLVIRGAGEGAAPVDALAAGNVEIVRQNGPQRDRLWFVRLARVLREKAIDVLHIRGLAMLVDGVLAARLCGHVATAFSFHGFEAEGRRFGRLRRHACRAAASRCDDRWAVSRAAAAAIAGELDLPVSAFGVLNNGVYTSLYMPAACPGVIRRRLGLPADRLVVLAVGNLKPIKGHDVLLDAVRQSRGDADRLTLVLVGEDYLGGGLQRWAGEHLAGADIRFVGRQDDILPWYQAADLFVSPSRWEGMCNAVLEAMSCGLTVVATAVGGNRDVIEHGRTGLLVESGNPVELAMAIRWLIKDEPRRAAMGATARLCVRERFDASLALARHAERYAALAERKRAAGRNPAISAPAARMAGADR